MTEPTSWTQPGVQFFPVERYSQSHTVRFVGVTNSAKDAYQTGGTYNVTATVTDNSGRERSWTQTIYVGNAAS